MIDSRETTKALKQNHRKYHGLLMLLNLLVVVSITILMKGLKETETANAAAIEPTKVKAEAKKDADKEIAGAKKEPDETIAAAMKKAAGEIAEEQAAAKAQAPAEAKKKAEEEMAVIGKKKTKEETAQQQKYQEKRKKQRQNQKRRQQQRQRQQEVNMTNLMTYDSNNTAMNNTDLTGLHVITRKLLEGEKVFIYRRGGNGMGSFLLNFFALVLNSEATQGRTVFVLDDVGVQSYRKSNKIGVAGYFDFKFPVFNTRKDYDRLFDEFRRVGLDHLTYDTYWIKAMQNDTLAKDYPILRIRQSDRAVFVSKRKESKNLFFSTKTIQMPVVERFKNLTCSNMWFNNETLQYTRQRLQNHSIPDFALSDGIQTIDGTSNSDNNSGIGTTVAFHMRRGDKVFKRNPESKLFVADEYVEKFLAIPDINVTNVKHCFVESDEYNATEELRMSLQEHNVSCQFHTMVPLRYLRTMKTGMEDAEDKYKFNFVFQDRKDTSEVMSFLSGLYMLVHSTYFIGTFNSNVGGLVTLLRGCIWKGTTGDVNDVSYDNKLDHFYHSYGVDSEDWFIKNI